MKETKRKRRYPTRHAINVAKIWIAYVELHLDRDFRREWGVDHEELEKVAKKAQALRLALKVSVHGDMYKFRELLKIAKNTVDKG